MKRKGTTYTGEYCHCQMVYFYIFSTKGEILFYKMYLYNMHNWFNININILDQTKYYFSDSQAKMALLHFECTF